jgi:hypothetical protein
VAPLAESAADARAETVTAEGDATSAQAALANANQASAALAAADTPAANENLQDQASKAAAPPTRDAALSSQSIAAGAADSATSSSPLLAEHFPDVDRSASPPTMVWLARDNTGLTIRKGVVSSAAELSAITATLEADFPGQVGSWSVSTERNQQNREVQFATLRLR